MQLRPLGSTSFLVSPIGLGMAALGRPGYINLGHHQDISKGHDISAMKSRAHQVLNFAYKEGVRYFDTARSYGKGEAFLAEWLAERNLSRKTVSVGSKWGYTYTADWQIEAAQHEIKEHSLPVLQRQWQESQALMGQRLGLYQIHSATLASGVLINAAVLAELAQLKSRHQILIGLSLSGTEQASVLEKAMEVRIDGQPLFDAVQATWNILEPSAGPMLAAARQSGMGIIIKEALANGRLTSRNDQPDFQSNRMILQQEANRLKTSLDALALAAVLAQPWADVVLSGAATETHLASNLKAIAVEWDSQAAEQLSTLAEPAASYWQTRSQLAWN